MRGGGGNFGVVTTFEFQLHEMDRQVIGGDVVFPLAQLPQLLSFYADYAQSAPDDPNLRLIGLPLSLDGERPPMRKSPPSLGRDNQAVFGRD